MESEGHSYSQAWAQGVYATSSSGLNHSSISALAFSTVSLPWTMFLQEQADT